MKKLLLILLLLGCNPVKQVLKDKEKLDKVAEVVISSGYCVNDTIIKTQSDTTITYDTIIEKREILKTLLKTDTLTIPLTKKIVKTITIRDTIEKVVTDYSRIRQLEAKLAVQIEKTQEYQHKAKSRLNWLIWLLIAISLYLIRKPIINLIKWHLPMLK
jgi:hypothetical protein